MAQDIPQWAIDRVLVEANRSGIPGASPWTSDEIAEAGDSARYSAVVRAYARYIAAHEEPPVDPLLIEAREIAANIRKSQERFAAEPTVSQRIREGKFDDHQLVRAALEGLRRSASLTTTEGGK